MRRRQAGLLLGIAQVALVGSLGLKLLVDRARLPRGWARTMPYDPSAPIRGRYVRLGLEVPVPGAPRPEGGYDESGVRLRVVDGRVVGELDTAGATRVQVRRENGRWSSRLAQPIAFFIPEHVPDPSVRRAGEELWAEVTIPSAGPPRPIRLGVMKGGALEPLDLR